MCPRSQSATLLALSSPCRIARRIGAKDRRADGRSDERDDDGREGAPRKGAPSEGAIGRARGDEDRQRDVRNEVPKLGHENQPP